MDPAHDHHNPWIFRRDEIDVLEDAFDEIFQRHDALKDPVQHALEERVLKEQIETEEKIEAELTARFGLPEPDDAAPHLEDDVLGSGSIKELLKRDIVRDPFYEQAFLWSAGVVRFARDAYERGGGTSLPLFRAYVNAHLVPAHVAFAQAEETHEHANALTIAQKEYELAETYAARALESLEAAHMDGAPGADAWFPDGKRVVERLRHARERLNRPGRFRT